VAYSPGSEASSGEPEAWLASDIPALLPYTRDVTILDDDELAFVTREGLSLERLTTQEILRRVPYRVEWDVTSAEKGGYPHFMLKEIHEQPRALADAMRGRIETGRLTLPEITLSPMQARAFDRVQLVACGTSYHASLIGRRMMEQAAGVGADVEIGSEYRYRDPVVTPRTLVVAVSQSGETADTLAALTEAKARGAYTVAVCNVVGSALSRLAHSVIYTQAGPEMSVASTKAFTTQLAVLYLLSLRMGELRNRLSPSDVSAHLAALAAMPEVLAQRLSEMDAITAQLAARYADRPSFIYIGRGTSYPLALEGALKLKEISYLRADGYAAGELKHGPIALISAGVPVVAIAPRDSLHGKMQANIAEVRARGGEVISLCTDGDDNSSQAEAVIRTPAATELCAPLLLSPPLQLFAYHMAVQRGCDVDRPRNLAKSVTVE
jgi:glutamine---fructose-6-phosphate transaminase (isomerizing)